MVNSRHLKRSNMPMAWSLKRKGIKYISKPNPGSYGMGYVVPLVVALRDILGVVSNLREARYVVNKEEILVNGKRVMNVKYPCGLFDVLEIKKTGDKFTFVFDGLGSMKPVPISDNLIYLKVSGKKIGRGKIYQLNFANGFNLLVDEKRFNGVGVEDTVVYDFSLKKIVDVFNLREGNFVYFFDGKFKGKTGVINGINNFKGLARNTLIVEVDGKVHSTAKDYCFVFGKSKEILKRFS